MVSLSLKTDDTLVVDGEVSDSRVVPLSTLVSWSLAVGFDRKRISER